jgi:hypothetical protein
VQEYGDSLCPDAAATQNNIMGKKQDRFLLGFIEEIQQVRPLRNT